MPKRPHGDGESRPHAAPGNGGSRPRGPHTMRVESIREAHEAIRAEARAGRAGQSVTEGTGEPHGRPEGQPSRVPAGPDETVRQSIIMENSAAAVLADGGWRVKQNPTPQEVARAREETGDTGKPASNPDYLLEGRVFDCYSPSPVKKVRGVWSEVWTKVVARRQAQRVVLNMADWPGDLSALRKQFADWPIPGLKEAKAITPSGDIVQLDLHPDNY
jgi:hypothetical protein